jgi:hypothetical protein
MRMPPHQLVVQMVQHIGNGEMALVGRHLRIKQHLQQQVAQLLGQVRKVAPLNGVEDLVGLFQRVFADGIEGLFAVPRAAAGSPQPRHDLDRLLKQAAARAGSAPPAVSSPLLRKMRSESVLYPRSPNAPPDPPLRPGAV